MDKLTELAVSRKVHVSELKSGERDSSMSPRALEALRESEALFRTLAECAPVVVWMTDTKNETIYISHYWREFSGRDPADDLGFKWVEAIHPKDRDRAARDLLDAAAARQPVRGEYRVKRADGEYGWLSEYGVPYFQADGTYAGYVGTCMDITDHKNREHRVQSSLLLGQENERKRVARELHDGVSQRIALVGIALSEAQQLATGVSPSLEEKLSTVRNEVELVADDLHHISRNLHPSAVSHLGLVAAVRRLCNDLSTQMRISVVFLGSDLFPRLSEEVELALYRVTQEGLSNIVKHSKSPTAQVSLSNEDGLVSLSIADVGVGFEISRLTSIAGLGLTSIQERARMIGAEVEVRSAPSEGTVIELHLPSMGQGNQ